jgi:hypothetical protein
MKSGTSSNALKFLDAEQYLLFYHGSRETVAYTQREGV